MRKGKIDEGKVGKATITSSNHRFQYKLHVFDHNGCEATET